MLEERGYRRDMIGSLTWVYIHHVLQHPRDKHGRLQMPTPKKSPLSEREELRWFLRLRGIPSDNVDEHVARMMAEQQARAKAKGKGRRK